MGIVLSLGMERIAEVRNNRPAQAGNARLFKNLFTNFLADWNLFLYFKVKVDEESL